MGVGRHLRIHCSSARPQMQRPRKDDGDGSTACGSRNTSSRVRLHLAITDRSTPAASHTREAAFLVFRYTHTMNNPYRDIFEAMNKAGIRYLVVGGVAVNLHGYSRFTGDL